MCRHYTECLHLLIPPISVERKSSKLENQHKKKKTFVLLIVPSFFRSISLH